MIDEDKPDLAKFTRESENYTRDGVGVEKNNILDPLGEADNDTSNNLQYNEEVKYENDSNLIKLDIHCNLLPPPGGGYSLLRNGEKLLNTAGQDSISEEELDGILDLTIKGDEVNRKILFIGSLLNYTKADQLNFGLSGDSAIGKSHNCLEIAALHPRDSVMKLSYTSPKAFFHDKGVLIDDKTGEPMMAKSEYMEKVMLVWEAEHPHLHGSEYREARRNAYRDALQRYYEHPKHLRVDLKQKLLVFVDMPSPELLTYLRSLLSHDEPSIWVKITDKDRGGGNQTKNVEIIGFPTLFFNSTNFAMDAQEQTRLFLLSPEGDQAKLRKTLPFIAEKVGNRPKYKAFIDASEKRNRLMGYVERLRGLGVQEIIIAEEDVDAVVRRFMEEHQVLIPRFQRDLPRLMALIKGYALFFAPEREMDKDSNLHATADDVARGYELYKSVSDSNELGLPPHIYDFYRRVMEPTLRTGVGFTRRELALEYFNTFKMHIGENQLGRIIQLLNEVGLVVEENDPEDRRVKRIYNAAAKAEEGALDVALRKTMSDVECLSRIPQLVKGMGTTMDGSVAREDLVKTMMRDWGVKEAGKCGKLIDTAMRDGSIYAPRPGAVRAVS